ncbi:DNA polymerase [Actinocrispum wychmicini]|uniref:DNA polymerase I n=1 Tax=Actinocrispum wychmicini TaxID=1213861 RepID=A0A4R2JK25_9PSEU|nr:DNA polymerase [Actinocrispum wychmicini]TCO56879.1 DNA polymerase-1 [Actinocrispum wychmicini]
MQQHHHTVAGNQVTINVVQSDADLTGFRDFVRQHLRALAVDTETTGLDIYSATHKLRLIQFGTTREAWVLPVEHGGQIQEDTRRALRGLGQLVIHNAPYDLQVAQRHLGIRMEELWPKVRDTKILAHLVDPRGQDEGGIGHGLEALTRHHVDPVVADEVKGLMSRLAKKYKTTKAKIWSAVDIADPEYTLYAGMDTILTARLTQILTSLVPHSARPLIAFEHQIAEVCSYMERTGFLLDVDYTLDLSARLAGEEMAAVEIAKRLGCDNVNSTEQVADVLEHRGVEITGRTPTGRRQVDKRLLATLAAQGDEFALAVQDAKKARKWRTTWVDGFLAGMDPAGRCHASINSLRARTARMSITGIPAQTLPAGDYLIRRCFLAEHGHRVASVDYKGQELRVLAALSGDRTMIKAFAEDANLHLMTARAAFGPEVLKDTKEYKAGKMTNFARVFGGGAKTVSEQAGIPLAIAKAVVEAFDKRYPGVAARSRKLQHSAARRGYITTPAGRRLPVDPARAYSALNYEIQSTSRDVTCRGLLRLHKAGYTPYLRLPIHDEVIASLPAARAEWGAGEIARLMAEHIGPVHIDTDHEVGLRSWGSLYGAEF